MRIMLVVQKNKAMERNFNLKRFRHFMLILSSACVHFLKYLPFEFIESGKVESSSL